MSEPSLPIAYLDTMTFIFSIEGRPEIADPVNSLFRIFQEHPGAATTSELTLAEVLTGSKKGRNPSIRRAYFDLIIWSKLVDLVPISRDILCESADLRFAHEKSYGKKLKLPDAIHLTTAIQKRCRYFISSDAGICPPERMKRINPDESAIAEISKALA